MTEYPSISVVIPAFNEADRLPPTLAEIIRYLEAAPDWLPAELIVVEGEPVAQRQMLAHSIVGMTESASRYWLAHDREPDVDTLATQLSQLAWSGLRGIRTAD